MQKKLTTLKNEGFKINYSGLEFFGMLHRILGYAL